MPIRKKPHPVDLADAEVLATAIRFDVALFLGVGRYAHASAETLDGARVEAKRLVEDHHNGRRALIYAVNAAGRSALITDAVVRAAQ
jgi:hypothetical protein